MRVGIEGGRKGLHGTVEKVERRWFDGGRRPGGPSRTAASRLSAWSVGASGKLLPAWSLPLPAAAWLRRNLVHDRGPAHAIGEHMMGAEVQRRPAVGQALDEGGVPGGAVRLEGEGLDETQQVQDVAQVPGAGTVARRR